MVHKIGGKMVRNVFFVSAIVSLTIFTIFLPLSSERLAEKKRKNHLSDQAKITSSHLQASLHDASDALQIYELKTFVQQDRYYIRLEELTAHLPIQSKINQKDGEIILIYGSSQFQLIRDIPVLNNNGLFEPLDAAPVMTKNEIWIPISMIEQVFKQKMEIKHNKALLYYRANEIPVFSPKVSLPKMSALEIVHYLSFLKPPLQGARVSTQQSHLPGSPRPYRGGIHEGVDWYSYGGTGVNITKNTAIHSVANGIVVRADHQYKEMTVEQREQLLAIGINNDGQTSQYILDKLRGRSVWIQSEKGILVRYVHLDRIPSHIQVGQQIKTGEMVGYVGNSGTSDGAEGNETKGLHLHLDLFLYGEWFWKNYSMHERRMILERVFDKNGS
jgi:murein DD-endopeptidase MepM/ murein hydrolase activator NlpD